MVYFRDAFISAPTIEARDAALKAQLAAVAAEKAAKDACDEIERRGELMRCPNTRCSAVHLKSAYVTKNDGKATIFECIGLFCEKCKSFYRI